MKQLLFAFLLVLLPTICISQGITDNDQVSYLDKNFKLGTADNYRYLQVIKNYKIPDSATYQVRVYYKSGKIQMRGATTSRNWIHKTGSFIYYYENSTKKTIINYLDDKPVGDCLEFYENGQKKYMAECTEEKDMAIHMAIPHKKIKMYWNEKGNQIVTDGFGYIESEFGKQKIVNSLKDSIWSGIDGRTKNRYIEKYDKGTFISGVNIDSMGVENKYTSFETKPRPPGGMDGFYKYIGKNFQVPNVKGLQGKVFLSFVVDIDGQLTDIRVLRDLGFGTGEQAISVLKGYGKWIPGEQRGEKVRCSFSLPISIQSWK